MLGYEYGPGPIKYKVRVKMNAEDLSICFGYMGQKEKDCSKKTTSEPSLEEIKFKRLSA